MTDTPRCAWCGETYDEHVESRAQGAPVPRTPCVLLRRNFKLRLQPAAPAPTPRVCGCDDSKAWKARALKAESDVERYRAMLKRIEGELGVVLENVHDDVAQDAPLALAEAGPG